MRFLTFAVRMFFFIVATLLPLIILAQDTLSPKWVALGAQKGETSYSSEGKYILVTNASGFTVYLAQTAAAVVHEQFTSFGTAAFSADSKNIYYALEVGSNYKLFRFNIADKSHTALPNAQDTSRITYITSSKIGDKLGYITTSGKVHVYDLASSTEISQFQATTGKILFIANGTQLLGNQLRTWDLNGGLIRSNSGISGKNFDISKDESMGIVSTYKSISAYSFSDLHLIWTYQQSGIDIRDVKFTQDSKGVIFSMINDDGRWACQTINAATGSPLSHGAITIDIHGLTAGFFESEGPKVAVSPTSNRVIVGPEIPIIAELTVNTTTGNSIETRRIAGGYSRAYRGEYPSCLWFRNEPFTTSPTSIIETSNAVYQASTGQLWSIDLHPKDYYWSPSGRYIVVKPHLKLSIARYLQDPGNTYLVDPDDQDGTEKGWVNDHLMWVNKGHSKGILLIRNEDSGLTKFRAYPGDYEIAAVTVDETRIAMRKASGAVEVRNITEPAILGTIAPLGGKIDTIRFIAGNRLVLREYNEADHENTLRIYDVTAAPVLLHKFTESSPTDQCTGTVSPGGNYFAFTQSAYVGEDQHLEGSLNVYRVSDGQPVRQWANQFVPAPALEFSPDEFLLVWPTRSGMLVTAVIPTLPTEISVSPTMVTGAGSVTGTVKLNRIANQDTAVHLTSSSTAVTVPVTVTIPSGEMSAKFTAMTKDVVAPTMATLTATLGGATTAISLSINPSIYVVSLSSSATDLSGNTTVNVTVNLNGPAPTGFSVPASSSAAAVTVPSSISISEGQSSGVVALPVKQVAADKTVKITIGGQTVSINLHTPPVGVTAVTSNKTEVTGNDTIEVTVYLDRNAPSGGFTAPASCNAASITIPATVTIPGGQNTYTFVAAVKKVTADRTATITIGGKSVTINLHKP